MGIGHTGITWGKVLAGASIAVGAVILTTAFFPQATPEKTFEAIKNGVGDFLEGIKNMFMGNSTQPDAPQLVSPGLQKGLLGAAVIGGGLTLRSHLKGKEEDMQYQENLQASQVDQQGTFAMKEQMRAMQGLMKARMAAASPEYMAGQARAM